MGNIYKLVPFIVKGSAIGDGQWAKRSYNYNYNALACICVLISVITNKIFYVGHKCKFCVICKKYPLKEHDCA